MDVFRAGFLAVLLTLGAWAAPAQAADTCFFLEGWHCGPTVPVQEAVLPATVGGAGAACLDGWLVSPVGCALADGRVTLGAGPTYLAWLATGDLFRCPSSEAPTAGAGCAFLYRTVGVGGLFSAAAREKALSCPAPLSGVETASGRIVVWIGLGLPGGGWRAEPAIVDTGSPHTYLQAAQLSGTAWHAAGLLGQVTFPLWGDRTVPDRPYSGPLAIFNGSAWVPLGEVTAQAIGSPAGDGLGMDALRGLSLSVAGGAWTLSFPC